jgi:hypothetical protein
MVNEVVVSTAYANIYQGIQNFLIISLDPHEGGTTPQKILQETISAIKIYKTEKQASPALSKAITALTTAVTKIEQDIAGSGSITNAYEVELAQAILEEIRLLP